MKLNPNVAFCEPTNLFESSTSVLPFQTRLHIYDRQGFSTGINQGVRVAQWVKYNVVGLPNNSYKPITNTAWVRAQLCKLQKRCTRLAAASDKVYQLLAHGRWFSPGTPASSTTKTGRHDIAEILLKVALNTINQIHKNITARVNKFFLMCCKPITPLSVSIQDINALNTGEME